MMRDLMALVTDDLIAFYTVGSAVGFVCCDNIVIFIDDYKAIFSRIDDALQVYWDSV